MNVLIDTSIWVDHFRCRNDRLIDLIERDVVLSHSMVILELACGTPPAPRSQTLHYLKLLRRCHEVSWFEVMDFVEREHLYGLGCGLVDLSLLAATLITPNTMLWTLDKRLYDLAKRFHIAYQSLSH